MIEKKPIQHCQPSFIIPDTIVSFFPVLSDKSSWFTFENKFSRVSKKIVYST